MRGAFDNVDAQQVFYGNTLSRLNSASTFLNAENVQLSQEENNLVAVDIATAASQLTQAETALDATLAAGGSISKNSLLDYLK